MNIEAMAVKRCQTSSNTLKIIFQIQKIIYHDVWQVFDSILNIYRQLSATKSDFFDPKTPFFGPFLTINNGTLAAKVCQTAVVWCLKMFKCVLNLFNGVLAPWQRSGAHKDV